MAQAGSVPSPIRAPIPGASSRASTTGLRADQRFGDLTEDLTRRWYEAITDGIPLRWYVVAVCYATAVISLAWFPWNFIFILLLSLIRNQRLRASAFDWFRRLRLRLADLYAPGAQPLRSPPRRITSRPNFGRRWHETITGRMPMGWYIAAICYATVVILLGWLPWNALLILLLFSDSKRLRFDAFDTMPPGKLGSSQ